MITVDIQLGDGRTLSSSLTGIHITSTAGGTVKVTILLDTDVLLDETYYPTDGVVDILDLKNLIQPLMRKRKEAAMAVSVKEFDQGGTQTASALKAGTVVYCDVAVDGSADDFLAYNFLTVAGTRRITYRGSVDLLYTYSKAPEKASVTAVCLKNGKLEVKTASLSEQARHGRYTSYATGESDIRESLGVGDDVCIGEYSITVGGRSVTYTVGSEDMRGRQAIAFVNAFGVTDMVPALGKVEEKANPERSILTVGGVQRMYGVKSKTVMTVHSGVTHVLSRPLWVDLLNSEDVKLVRYGYENGPEAIDVVVTDADVKWDDSHTEIESVSITVEAKQPYSRKLGGTRQTPHRVFDYTFDNTFE